MLYIILLKYKLYYYSIYYITIVYNIYNIHKNTFKSSTISESFHPSFHAGVPQLQVKRVDAATWHPRPRRNPSAALSSHDYGDFIVILW